MIDVSPYIGLPFAEHSQGGYDCLGLVRKVFKDIYGYDPFGCFLGGGYANSGDQKKISSIIHSAKPFWTKIDQPKEGAVVVFNLAGNPHHIGLCVGRQGGHDMFLHVYKGINTICERLDSTVWRNRIEGYYVQ